MSVVLFLLACASVRAWGETFVWTGEGTADSSGVYKFTDTANWRLESTGEHPTRAPGMIWAGLPQSQAKAEAAWATYDSYPNDVIVFGEGTGDATSIDLTGHICVSNIIFTGNCPVYTFKNYPLGLRQIGTLEIKSDVANLPILEGGLSFGTGVSGVSGGNSVNYIINDKVGSQLAMPTVGRPSVRDNSGLTHYGSAYFQGAGGFRFGKLSSVAVVYNYYTPSSPRDSQAVHRTFCWRQAGKATFYLSGTMDSWCWVDHWNFQGPNELNEVELLSGACLYTSGNGGRYHCYSNTVFTGNGTVYVNGNEKSGTKRGAIPLALEGKTVYLRCRVANSALDDDTFRFITWDGSSETCFTGTVDMTQVVENTPTGGVYLHFPVTVRVSAIDGTASGTKKAFGTSPYPVALSGGSILAYAGPGESTTRSLTITNLYRSNSSTSEGTLATTLSQRGTGKWTLTNFRNNAGGTQTATLTLDNITAFDAEMASAIGNNPAGTRVTDIVKTGPGKWILSAENTTAGLLTIREGAIEVTATGKTGNMTYDFGANVTNRYVGSGVWRPLNLITARDGLSTVILGAGSVAQLNVTPVSVNGGRVNFITESGTVFTFPTAKGCFLPRYVTLNGQYARVNGDGAVVAVDSDIVPSSEIPAKGGVITNGEGVVGITYEGTTGPITLSDTETSVGMLAQMSITPATVSIKSDETLSLATLAIAKNGASLTVEAEEGGQLAVAVPSSQGMTIRNESASELIVTAPLSLPSGLTINKLGAGPVALPEDGSWSSDFSLIEGSLAIGALDFSSPSLVEAFNYSTSGDTGTLTTLDGATTRVAGSTGTDRFLSINVPSGEMTVKGPGHIETKSVTVGGDGDAKLVVKDGADIYFPQKNGTFQLGKISGTASTGVAEMDIANAWVGTLFYPGVTENDYCKFDSRSDRAVVVGGSSGDAILSVHAGAVITNRIMMGANNRQTACYMDGGDFLSLGGDENSGGDKYAMLGYCGWGYANQSCFMQTGGNFVNYASLHTIGSGAGFLTWIMTGGNFRICKHPLWSPDNGSRFAIQYGTGAVAVYVGGNARWIGEYTSCLADHGSGTSSFTADGHAEVRFLGYTRFGNNTARPRSHPLSINLNGNSLAQFNYLCLLDSGIPKMYDENGNRTNSPTYLNINGGRIIKDYNANGGREFIPTSTKNGKVYQVFERITVYENGATYMQSNGYCNANGLITNATGKGVWSIPLDEPITGKLVPPTVLIEGDGSAASAIALFDPNTLTTTNILVTSHGVDYTWAQAKLYHLNKLIKTIDCELKDNSTGPLTFTGDSFMYISGCFGVPQIVFDLNGVYSSASWVLPGMAEVTVNKSTLSFDNGGGSSAKYWNNIPGCLRCDTGKGSLSSKRASGSYETQGFPVRGSTGLNWNWLSNNVVGVTRVDCEYLVSNKIAGVTVKVADKYTKGLFFRDTATIEFYNTSALRAADQSYTVLHYEPTGTGVPADFTGMPTLTGKLPRGWYMRKVGNEIQLSIRRGLTAVVW